MPDQRSIFLSYRRQGTSHLAGRLADRLVDKFGKAHVFMDVDSIAPGRDFGDAIEDALGECAVLLVLIGPTWVGALDARGRRRLDDPDDLVVLEIQAALDRTIPVIPILADGAEAPTRDDLPQSLAALARRHAVHLDHDTFSIDCAALVQHITQIVTEASEPPVREAKDQENTDFAHHDGGEQVTKHLSEAARDGDPVKTNIANKPSTAAWSASPPAAPAPGAPSRLPQTERASNKIRAPFTPPTLRYPPSPNLQQPGPQHFPIPPLQSEQEERDRSASTPNPVSGEARARWVVCQLLLAVVICITGILFVVGLVMLLSGSPNSTQTVLFLLASPSALAGSIYAVIKGNKKWMPKM